VLRWGALALIWSIAIGAIAWRMIFCEVHPGTFGVIFFMLCGWSCAATAHTLQMRHGWSFIQPVALSGLAYTLGAIGLVTKWPDVMPGIIGHHDVWHIAVLIGLALHCRFISQFTAGQMDHLVPLPAPASASASLPIFSSCQSDLNSQV
jgi:hemolysin III